MYRASAALSADLGLPLALESGSWPGAEVARTTARVSPAKPARATMRVHRKPVLINDGISFVPWREFTTSTGWVRLPAPRSTGTVSDVAARSPSRGHLSDGFTSTIETCSGPIETAP